MSLELPDEFEGLPDRVVARAQAQAEALLPSNIVGTLGQARAEEVLVNATAHVLAITRAGTGEDPPPGVPTGNFEGSPYGQLVRQTLGLMGKPTGRVRVFPISSSEP